MLLGEKINVLQMAPVQPLQNIYLPQVMVLAQIKLRLAILNTHGKVEHERQLKWREAMKDLELGLQLTRTAASKQTFLEAQLLFNIGMLYPSLHHHLQHRYVVSIIPSSPTT